MVYAHTEHRFTRERGKGINFQMTQAAKVRPFEVENLDGVIDPQELRTFADKLRSVSGNAAKATAEYARRKAEAMEDRLLGRIQSALEIEAQCERIYGRLPEWAKW